MKKLIIGLVLAGLLLAPGSVAKAQVVDEAAILAQLNLIYAQLVQMLNQLQTQLAAQIEAQNTQIVDLKKQNDAISSKVDKAVANTEPVPTTPTTPEPEPEVVTKELVFKVSDKSLKLNEESATFIVQVLHDGVPAKCIPFTVKSSDPEDANVNRLNKRTFCTKSSDAGVAKGWFGDFGYDPKNVGTFTFEVTAEGMTKNIEVTVVE